MAGRWTRWSLTDSPRIIIVSARSTMRACLFLFHGQIEDQSPEPAFLRFYSRLYTRGPRSAATFPICPASQRDPQRAPQCDCFSNSEHLRHLAASFHNRLPTPFLTLAFRRKYSLKVTTLRLHGLPCPWIYFSCIPDLGVPPDWDRESGLTTISTVT